MIYFLGVNALSEKDGPHPLVAVGPLDWLFSDSEPEPPSSPKLVGVSRMGTTEL